MKKIAVLLIILFLLSGCAATGQPVRRTGFYLGTVVDVTVYGRNAEKFINIAFTEIERLENMLSRTKEGSDIHNLNKNAGIADTQVSPETEELIRKSKEYHILSKGYFDVTIGPLVDLWKIGTPDAAVPDEKSIKDALANIGMDRLMTSYGIALKDEGMSLDTGGIAKGYIADKVAEKLREEGCGAALINLGGNVLTIGEKPDGAKWRIGIQDPFKALGEYIDIVEIGGMSVVTSGNYERFFQEDGVRYHHILDPFTGYPVDKGIAAVSVICPKAIDGDALSTTVFALGVSEGLELIENTPGTECMIIMSDGTIHMSSGLVQYLTD